MKKFLAIFTVFAACLAVSFPVRSQDETKKLNQVLAALHEEDCQDCEFSQSEKRARIISILNYYNIALKWGYKPFEEKNLGWIISKSSVKKGYELAIATIYIVTSANEMHPSAPKRNTEYVTFKGEPFIEIEGIIEKTPQIVMKEVSEPIIETPKVAEVKPIQNEAPELAEDDTLEGQVIINNYFTCQHEEKKKPSPSVSDPETYVSSPYIAVYQGERYAYKNGAWILWRTGVPVGPGMSAYLSNWHGSYGRNYPSGGYMTSPSMYYDWSTLGSNIPGHRIGR